MPDPTPAKRRRRKKDAAGSQPEPQSPDSTTDIPVRAPETVTASSRMDIPVRQPEIAAASDGQECPSYEDAPWASPEALAAFLVRHVTPYDPDTDDYDRPPFASDIKEGKNDPIYNAHSYHTKVPPRSIIPYILHYTKPGDVILDPFCGSGMTGVAAQMCADPPADILAQFPDLKDRVGPRACVLNDLSPAACHIAYNYNTPVDVDALRAEFERIKAAVKDEFDWLYGTEHYEPAVGLYDPKNPEVASRLKNPSNAGLKGQNVLFDDDERIWELLDKAEVEERLGYPVTELLRDDAWGDLDVTTVERWICIPATIQYTIWSDVYRCEGFVTIEEPTGKISTRGKNAGKPMVRKRRVARGCGNEIVLWEVAVDHTSAHVFEEFVCKTCGQAWKKVQLKRTDILPVLTNYSYGGLRQKGNRQDRRVECSLIQTERRTGRREFEKTREISRQPIQWIFPDVKVNTTGPQYNRNALSARGIKTLRDFYTTRNLRALACLWTEASRSANDRPLLLFPLTGTFGHIERMTRYKFKKGGNSSLTGQLYFPSFSVEDNILRQLESKVKQIERAGRLLWALAEHRDNALVCCGHAGALAGIADASIDFVFADPPFGSNIYYSEVNWLYECWLGRLTHEPLEAVVHRKNDRGTKSIEDYTRLMGASFREMFRVLKPNRWATVEFNNNDGRIFHCIKEAIREAGFEIVNMLLLDKEHKTFKQIKGAEAGEDFVEKDVLFNLHKPAVVRREVRAEERDLEHQIVDVVRQHLTTLPERIKKEPKKYSDDHRTTATINSVLMNVLIPRGVGVQQLRLPFIERVCARYFRKIGQHWYLRGQTVGNGTSHEGFFEEEVRVTDEVTAIEWLRQKLHAAPMLVGELKPLWMQATVLLPAAVSQALSLEDLLAENFWRDEDSNRWREPTDEERERMNDDRSIRILHDAERYVAGTLRRETTDAERCDWIDILFRACRDVEEDEARSTPALRGFDPGNGYRLVSRLFQSLLKERVPPADFTRAEKQTAVASRRIGQQVQEEDQRRQAEQVKKRGPTLFDMDEAT